MIDHFNDVSDPANQRPIGVTGIARQLPANFPVSKPENSGNIVHGNAPFSIFRNAEYSVDRNWQIQHEGRSFREFVNADCSHVVVTVANLIRVGNTYPATLERYRLFRERLEGYEKPIVIFGLGAQSTSDDIDEATLPPEAVDLLQFLADRATAISVRGEFTAALFRKFTSADNIHVTGCPSFFSRPEAFAKLRGRLGESDSGTPSFNATHYERATEMTLLSTAIREDNFLIEPANPALHTFYRDALVDPELASVPDELAPLLRGSTPPFRRSDLVNYFRSRYRLFRHLEPWIDFNHEHVSFTYGARFHVNMASLLSGRPALWLTHDSRTRELTDTLTLPSLALEAAAEMPSPKDMRRNTDYSPMFDNLRALFDRFNDFLEAADLPRRPLQF